MCPFFLVFFVTIIPSFVSHNMTNLSFSCCVTFVTHKSSSFLFLVVLGTLSYGTCHLLAFVAMTRQVQVWRGVPHRHNACTVPCSQVARVCLCLATWLHSSRRCNAWRSGLTTFLDGPTGQSIAVWEENSSWLGQALCPPFHDGCENRK
jgi:hypothetical protein